MYKKTLFTVLIVIGLLIHTGFSVDKSLASQNNQAYWPTKEWRTSTPEKQGVNSSELEKMDDYILKNCPLLRSVLVTRNGYIVFEKYYSGDKNHLNPLYSATKSITSILIGIALKQKHIKSIDQKMFKFLRLSGNVNRKLTTCDNRILTTLKKV